MKRRNCLLTFFLFTLSSLLMAQEVVDDSVQLSSFNIVASKTDLPASFVSMRFDSAQKAAYDYSNLSQLLGDNTGLFMKNYGVSGISTISLRGTDATHSKIFWNGISLNSPSLGQSDIRLLPMSMTSDVEIHSGTGSLMEGIGGFGGNVLLNNDVGKNFREGLEILATAGSFQSYDQKVKLNMKEGKWKLVSTFFRTQSENDFKYNDYLLNNIELKRNNAAVRGLSAMQEVYYSPNTKNDIAVRLWYQNTDRELPGILGKIESHEIQFDESVRSQLYWSTRQRKSRSEVVLGLIKDEISYKDDSLNINSFGRTLSQQANIKNTWFVSRPIKIMSQFRIQSDAAESSGIEGEKHRSISSVRSGISWSPKKKRLQTDLFMRIATRDLKEYHYLPLIGINYRIIGTSNWRIRSSFAQNVNFPTLNSLYWSQGGNPKLKEEKSNGIELGIVNDELRITKDINISTSLNLFRNSIDNWIIWLPEGNIWRPQNIRNVENQGYEWMANCRIDVGKSFWQLRATYSYTESTDQTDNNSNEGNQLIYIPRNKMTSYLEWNCGKWQLWWRGTFVDEVFIDPANVQYLPNYWIQDGGLGRNWKLRSTDLQLRFFVLNAFDEQYQVLAQRPMPGRNYKLSLKIRL